MAEPPREIGIIQRWMQAVIMHPGGVAAGVDSAEARREIAVAPEQVEAVITRSRGLTSLDRLEIYARVYYARLLECLRAEFPVLTRALGEDLFDEFALGYLERYPSRSYTLNRLGADFARYLDETRPSDDAWAEMVVDLARLEWVVAEVFDGPGVEGRRLLGPEGLTAIPTERRPEARLVPIPCLRLLALRYPIRPYYTALRDGADAAPPARSDSFLALTRRDYVVRLHDLEPLEYAVLAALLEGQPVGAAVGIAAQAAGTERTTLAEDLHHWFRDWAVAGFFRSVELR
jgi:hypothetical protein